MQALTPNAIVQELDKHIIGQQQAKCAVAIALRNRWRRMQLSPEAQAEINPKNILMIGPTGVGKTEIARRLAKLVKAPFTKVEATKFTEVGYVGREVDSIIKDLVEVAYKQCREQAMHDNQAQAQSRAEQRLLDVIVRPSEDSDEWQAKSSKTRDLYLKKLRNGELDEKEVDIEVSQRGAHVEVMAPPGMEEMVSRLQGMFSSMRQDQTEKRSVKVAQAMQLFCQEEAAKLIDDQEIRNKAIELTEQSGIVFIDEIDKIIRSGAYQGDVSREGVQRDLLPLVEGSSVSTRLGTVRTDFILFIASGAFQLAKPSDLIPELQGRLPIRVELDSLGIDELRRILTEPDINLLEQYRLLMGVEKISLSFGEDGISRIAEIAHQVNQSNENIGARRLHTMLEKLLDEVSFLANCHKTRKVHIDAEYVNNRLGEVIANEDLSRYVL